MRRRFNLFKKKEQPKKVERNLKKSDGGFDGVCPQFSRGEANKALCQGIETIKDCEGKHVNKIMSSKNVEYCSLHGASKKQVELIKKFQHENYEVNHHIINNKHYFTAKKGEKKVEF